MVGNPLTSRETMRRKIIRIWNCIKYNLIQILIPFSKKMMAVEQCACLFCYEFHSIHSLSNPQTARILTSHKGPTWAWEAQVLSHLYICNNQFDITYHVWFNKYKTRNYQYKWIWVNTDCTFFINDTNAMYASKAKVGPLCDFQILAIWV